MPLIQSAAGALWLFVIALACTCAPIGSGSALVAGPRRDHPLDGPGAGLGRSRPPCSLPRTRRSRAGPGFELSAGVSSERRCPGHDQWHAGQGVAQWSLAGLDSISSRQRDPIQDRSPHRSRLRGAGLSGAKRSSLCSGGGPGRQGLDRLGIALAPGASLAACDRVSDLLRASGRGRQGTGVAPPGGTVVRLLPQTQPQEVLPAIRAFEHDTTKLRTPDEVRYVGVFRGRGIGPDPGRCFGDRRHHWSGFWRAQPCAARRVAAVPALMLTWWLPMVAGP